MSADYSSLPTSTKDYVLPAKKLHPADESFLAAIPLSLARRRSIGERGVTGGRRIRSLLLLSRSHKFELAAQETEEIYDCMPEVMSCVIQNPFLITCKI